MSNPDPLFKKVWFTALEKSIAEGMFSQDRLLKMKKREETCNQESSVPHASTSTLPNSDICDSHKLSGNVTSSAEGDDIISRIAGNEKFRRWKAEMAHKEAVRGTLPTRKMLDMGSKGQCSSLHTTSYSNANTTVLGSLELTRRRATSSSDLTYPTGGRGPSRFTSGDLESYIRFIERSPMFSSSRTPARHSSEVRGRLRWIKINLGNYSGFELAANRFEDVGNPRPGDPAKRTCQSNHPSPDNSCEVNTSL
ncbi:hypothetical protein HOY80DRAFT_999722 [Tuber brumale]|nr:hypothetical protein HOY80DRAFT_999722 [Tuber brumale]